MIIRAAIVGLVLGYFASWLVAYIFFVGFDFSHLIRYFVQSWAGPGEVPAFIQWTGVIGGILSAIASLFLVTRRQQSPLQTRRTDGVH